MERLVHENRFIASLLASGVAADGVAGELTAIGWHPSSARRAVLQCMGEVATLSLPVVPGPDLELFPSCIDLGDRHANVLLRVHSPQLCLLGNVLSQEECLQLIEEARPRLARSEVVTGGGDANENAVHAYARTSEQAVLAPGASPLVDRVRRRVSRLTRWPDTHFEAAQIVRYGVGADFAPHHDYWCPDAHRDMIEREGQRLATVILYLNTPASGGATAFPDVELEIFPQQGSALFFAYPAAHPDTQTLHAGVPLTSGEKWIATFFLRDCHVRQPAG